MALQAGRKRKFEDANTVLIIVGQRKAKFRVHEHKLTESSTFFKAAFDTMRFKEGCERIMELLEEDVDNFENFVQWIYNGVDSLPDLHEPSRQERNLMLLLRLYVFADHRDTKDLRNMLIAVLVGAIDDKSVPAPSLSAISYVYADTNGPNAALRELVANWVAWRGDRAWFKGKNFATTLRQTPDFAADLVVALGRLRDMGGLFPRAPDWLLEIGS